MDAACHSSNVCMQQSLHARLMMGRTISHDDELPAGCCVPIQIIGTICLPEHYLMHFVALGQGPNPVLTVQRDVQLLCRCAQFALEACVMCLCCSGGAKVQPLSRSR